MHNHKVATYKHVYSYEVAMLAYFERGDLEKTMRWPTPYSRGNTVITFRFLQININIAMSQLAKLGVVSVIVLTLVSHKFGTLPPHQTR